jgi:hypothetical protein
MTTAVAAGPLHEISRQTVVVEVTVAAGMVVLTGLTEGQQLHAEENWPGRGQ